MKQFYQWISSLSLTRQLLLLMSGLMIFFSVFFFVYVNDAVNSAVSQQIYKSLDDTQNTLVSVNPHLDSYNKANGIETYPVEISGGNMIFYKSSAMYGLTEKEIQQIKNDIIYIYYIIYIFYFYLHMSYITKQVKFLHRNQKID